MEDSSTSNTLDLSDLEEFPPLLPRPPMLRPSRIPYRLLVQRHPGNTSSPTQVENTDFDRSSDQVILLHIFELWNILQSTYNVEFNLINIEAPLYIYLRFCNVNLLEVQNIL